MPWGAGADSNDKSKYRESTSNSWDKQKTTICAKAGQKNGPFAGATFE
jgi:hypothetical protein